jgi:hypothetical protein
MARRNGLLLASLLIGSSAPAFAAGGHLGWCNGVGNPHQVSSCGGSTQPPTTPLPGSVPTSNQLPGGAVPPTPANVPVLAPMQVPNQVPNATPGATPQMVPQTVAVPGQVPMQVPNATPGATPQMVPQIVAVPGQVPMQVPNATPGATPQMVPQIVAVPGQVPMQVPTAMPGATPMLVPRPNPMRTASVQSGTPGTITHSPTPKAPSSAKTFITSAPGRQAQHAAPQFAADDGGRPWSCVASGHGMRRSVVDGKVVVAGALRHVGAIDVLGRDLPALHPDRSDCIISVRRRSE